MRVTDGVRPEGLRGLDADEARAINHIAKIFACLCQGVDHRKGRDGAISCVERRNQAVNDGRRQKGPRRIMDEDNLGVANGGHAGRDGMLTLCTADDNGIDLNIAKSVCSQLCLTLGHHNYGPINAGMPG
jgi:hypothetical protein